MEQPPPEEPRVATVDDAETVAPLLDAFNREYDTPTPGTAVLAKRLERLLLRGDVIALLTGDSAVAVALLTVRPNVWYYERHGYAAVEPGQDQPHLYYYRELKDETH